MRCLVTGCAGFIGSQLSEKLIKQGFTVIGIDKFTAYYPKKYKENNLKNLFVSDKFKFIEADILNVDLNDILGEVDVVFHLAAQPGVRASWGESFNEYLTNNVLATQKILETSKNKPNIKKFVYSSSSSIYGDAEKIPVDEETIPRPISPYGVTKLAGEHLSMLYFKNYGIPSIALRYFTVYGPRQRPDMGIHKFIMSILKQEEIIVFGNGEQTRDFTYVDDIVDANILAFKSNCVGEVFNIGGGTRISVNDLIKKLETLLNVPAKVKHIEKQKGDVKDTLANVSKATNLLSYVPGYNIDNGLKNQIDWLKQKDII